MHRPLSQPAITRTNELKNRLLDDMVNVIDMEGRLNGKEKRVGGFDLIYNDAPVYVDETPLESFNLNSLRLNSFLGQTRHCLLTSPLHFSFSGCANDRNRSTSTSLQTESTHQNEWKEL